MAHFASVLQQYIVVVRHKLAVGQLGKEVIAGEIASVEEPASIEEPTSVEVPASITQVPTAAGSNRMAATFEEIVVIELELDLVVGTTATVIQITTIIPKIDFHEV